MLNINEDNLTELKDEKLELKKDESKKMKTGYASVDKPWMKWHDEKYHDIEIPSGNFYDYFMKMTGEYPSDTILLDYMGKIGYTRDQIDLEITKQANMFLNLGVKHGDIVSFMMLNVPEVIFMFLALNKIGAITNLIKFDESPERINYMLNLTNTKYFFINDVPFIKENVKKVLNLTNKLEKVIEIPVIESLQPSLKKYQDGKFISYALYKEDNLTGDIDKEVITHSDDTTLIVYTGGSTGDAKGVELTNSNLIAMAHGLKYSNYGFDYGKNSMNILPPAIAYYLNATCGLMICGVKVIQIPSFEIADYPNLVDMYKPNIIFSGPILLKMLAASQVKDFSYLTNPASGGDKLLAEEEMMINEALHQKGAGSVQQGYGSSEETAVATCNPLERSIVGSIGIPMVNVTISMFEYQSDKEIPYGVDKEGEICITGPTVMKGYLNNPKATEFVLKHHSDGKIWAHTDDIGVMDSDGYIYHRGRFKRMLTRSGTKLWLTALEEEIQKLGLLEACCAVKLDDEVEREVPVVHVVLKDNASEEVIYQIDEYLRNNCPPNYLPKYYIIKEELPYTQVNKKLDFKTLEKENILDENEFIINGKIIKPRRKVKKI